MKRKLVRIETIKSLSPIEGRDRIELAQVLGWTVFVEKGKYEVGEKVIFAECDSIFPEKTEYEFLRSCKFKIKTRKLSTSVGAVYSQGIIFKISDILSDEQIKDIEITNGYDLTDYLGVTKSEDPIPADNGQVMQYPSRITKTDENRIQNIPNIIDLDTEWTLTEKIDGTSFTCDIIKEEGKYQIMIGKHSLAFKDVKNNGLYSEAFERAELSKKLPVIFEDLGLGEGDSITLQGEIAGPQIQKNRLNIPYRKIFIFNVKINGDRLNSLDAKQLMDKYQIEFVPIIKERMSIKNMSVEEILKMADGMSLVDNTCLREGIVFRSINKIGNNIASFKSLSQEYIVKHKL